MKKSEIELGKTYTDKKGGVRRIVGVGPYVLYDGQTDTNCVRYRIMAKKLGPYSVGSEKNCTLISFAAWAKEEI